jgi:hypothetical protein
MVLRNKRNLFQSRQAVLYRSKEVEGTAILLLPARGQSELSTISNRRACMYLDWVDLDRQPCKDGEIDCAIS